MTEFFKLFYAMGLMYVLPATEEETERLDIVDKKRITLKSYGLPMIFWGYLAAAFTIALFMFLAVKGPMTQMINGEDTLNKFIGLAMYLIFIISPIITLGFYFYEKRII